MIGPGPITRSGARRATDFIRQAEANRQAVERRKKVARDRPWAKLTAYDPPSGAYSWTERTFDGDGQRIDKPGGRTGNKDWMPAYSFGGGNVVSAFPVEVQLRRTIETATKGPAYEFPLYCACAMFSGSGTTLSGTGVLTACCPGTIPTTLYAHVTVYGPSVNQILQTSFPIIFNDPRCNIGIWWGYSDPMSLCQFAGIIPRISVGISCSQLSDGTPWFTYGISCYYSIPTDCGNIGSVGTFAQSFQCSPFSVTFYRTNVVNCHPGLPGPCVFFDTIVNTTP